MDNIDNYIGAGAVLGQEDDLNLVSFSNSEFFDYDRGSCTNLQEPDMGMSRNLMTAATSPTSDGSLESPSMGLYAQPGAWQMDYSTFDPTYPNFSSFSNGVAVSAPLPEAQAAVPALSRPLAAPIDSKSGIAPVSAPEPARNAADEDKRRRNTAASARFRQKKKQREKEIEENSKALSTRVSELEATVARLETENGFLRNMLLEKNGKVPSPTPASSSA